MATQPLGTLIGTTVTFTQKFWKQLLLCALVLGTVHAVFRINMRQTAAVQMGAMMNRVGENSDRMEAVMERMQGGDKDAVKEFAEMMAEAGESGAGMMNNIEEARVKDMMLTVAPLIAGSALLSILFTLLASIYFFLVALKPQETVAGHVSRMPKLILPMLGLWLWTFLRSFAWIPFIGIIPALYFYPRFVAAPVYLIEQGKGVLDSTNLSLEATRYYWGKIVGNSIVLGIGLAIVSMVLGLIFSMFGSLVSIWLVAVLQQFLFGVFAVFSIFLAKTIMQNPLRPVRT